EKGDPVDKEPARADKASGARTNQHESAVRQQVAAGDPLQVVHREVQGAANRGERDIGDGCVYEVEERDRAKQRQRELAATGREERGLRGNGRHGGLSRVPLETVSKTYNTKIVSYWKQILWNL